MTFKLECKNGKFNLNNLELNEITDVFSITTINDNTFCMNNGEFVFSVSAKEDDTVVMYVTFHRKMFYCTGKTFAVYRYTSFDNVHLLDDNGYILFSVGVDKEVS